MDDDTVVILELSKININDDKSRPIILSTSLIYEIFEYIHDDYKLLIHQEDMKDEERSKRLSIELIVGCKALCAF